MSHRIWIILSVGAFAALAGCGLFTAEDDHDPFWRYRSEFSAEINGRSWSARAYAISPMESSVIWPAGVVFEQDNVNRPVEALQFINIWPEKERNVLPLFSQEESHQNLYWIMRDDPTKPPYVYYVAEPGGYVEIVSWDRETRWLEARFEVTLSLRPHGETDHRTDPDTLRFTNGHFRAYVWSPVELNDEYFKRGHW